jgi:hypothetical protein
MKMGYELPYPTRKANFTSDPEEKGREKPKKVNVHPV